jgi:hypothetical protein
MIILGSISIEIVVGFAGAAVSLLTTVAAYWMRKKLSVKTEQMLITVQGKDGHKAEFTIEKDDFERRFRNLHPTSESGTSAASH